MSDQEQSAPSTRWTSTRRGPSRELTGDEAVFRIASWVAGAVVSVVVLPALVSAVFWWAVWSWRRWPVWWLLPAAGAPLPAWLWFDGPARTVGAAEMALGRFDLDGLIGLWAAGWPAGLAAGAMVAAVVVGWRRMRSPSWRDSGPAISARKVRRETARTVAKLGTEVVAEDGTTIWLGVDESDGSPFGIPAASVGRHTLVVGATGSGKTTTANRIAAAVVEQGGGLVVVDLKGSPDTVSTWQAAADRFGRRCHVWAIGHPTVYDPFASGGPTEWTRKVMALADWSEPHYRDQGEQLLSLVLQVFVEVGERPTLARVHEVMTPAGLGKLARRSDGPKGADLAAETVAPMPKDRVSSVASVRTKLALLVQAQFGAQLDPGLAAVRADVIDVGAALDAGEIVVVSLDDMSFGHVAARMAEVVMTDVAAAAGARLRQPEASRRPGLVWVDEFSAMKPSTLASLFARAREARIGVMLSTQDPADLAKNDPVFREQVVGNSATVIVHRTQTPQSADWLSDLIGTRLGFQETSQVEAVTRIGEGAAGGGTGLGTIREVHEFVIHPNKIKALEDHHAYVLQLSRTNEKDRSCRIRVVPLARAVVPTPLPPEDPAPAVDEGVSGDPVPGDALNVDIVDVEEGVVVERQVPVRTSLYDTDD